MSFFVAFRRAWGAKGLKFSVMLADNLPDLIFTSSSRLQQCLISLLKNAVKFTEQGSVSLEVVSNSKNNQIKFHVNDTGIGISDDQYATIFSAFSQSDGSTSRKYDGTGLGLALTKKLVDLPGGKISMTSQPGQGSTFTITLPVCKEMPIIDDLQLDAIASVE